MKYYWVKTNAIIKKIFSNYVWDIPNKDNKIYLTFDDGPSPEITNWILAQLEKHSVKATFFCIGNNIDKYPALFNELIRAGHSIGNHTYDHVNGWKSQAAGYINNVAQCAASISQHGNTAVANSPLFRPPYGHIKARQSSRLIKAGYKIIMWDVLSADFDTSISPEQCLQNVIANLTSGSIVVFHDSVKAFKNLEYVLPRTLDFIKQQGYKCEAI